MTINYNNKNVPCRSRLPFGVPINDIFPSDDIHPHLKATFIRAYQDITSSRLPILDILGKYQGTVDQRLEVKKAVSECRQMPNVTPPGVILWVIRHFMGLLPIPLLPSYSDEKYFNWYQLARVCKQTFLQHRIVDVNNGLLTAKIAKDLLRLPSSNLLLFAILVQFIRLIASNKYAKKRLNHLTAYYMVRYFCSTLFLRPYTPGKLTKLDKQYFPLLLYIVLRWPEIQALFKQKSKLITSPQFEIPEELINTKKIYSLITKRYVDVSTQTDIKLCLLDRISEVSFETCDFLKDVGVQTCHFREPENLDFERSSMFSEDLSLTKLCGTQSSLSLISFDEVFKNVNERGSSPREIGCNTEYTLPIILKLNETSKIDRGVNTENLINYGWSTPKNCITPEGEYIYDSYDTSMLNLISPKLPEINDNNKEIMKKISKIGWTYTPPKSNTLIELNKDNEENLNNYTLCYGSKELLDVDIKETVSPKNNNLNEEENGHSVKRKRSNFSVASIKSKLDFLKKFTPRKNKLKTSNSLEEISNIKYKKMTSKKSTTF
ncbi:uncharacterized protein [Onthophagus taurus]|uniref:uncharacterized protein n=1 Tax=Onthophagus taurus TaxID=166361 RepID=UPI0039BDB58A